MAEEPAAAQGAPEVHAKDSRGPPLPGSLREVFQELQSNTAAFGGIADLPRVSTAAELRDCVRRNRPCIILGLLRESGCLERWADDQYLPGVLNTATITVQATPNGRGDAVTNVKTEEGVKQMFVKPEDREMPFPAFWERVLEQSSRPTIGGEPGAAVPLAGAPPGGAGDDGMEEEDEVLYYSQQNDCLRKEASALVARGDVPECPPIGAEVFGADKLDAANLWIGDAHATSSLHCDYYENLFSVVRGTKLFTLLPPTDTVLLDKPTWPAGRFTRGSTQAGVAAGAAGADGSKSAWCVEAEVDEKGGAVQTSWVDWSPVSGPAVGPGDPQAYVSPMRIAVCAGETLYLPSLWWHEVTQLELTIGVNWWFDMEFSDRYASFALLSSIAERLRG